VGPPARAGEWPLSHSNPGQSRLPWAAILATNWCNGPADNRPELADSMMDAVIAAAKTIFVSKCTLFSRKSPLFNIQRAMTVNMTQQAPLPLQAKR